MATRTQNQTGEGSDPLSKISRIQPGTVEMEQFLAVGYPRIGTVEKAKTIIKERPENPALWPYEIYEQAQAFMAAYNGRPQVISTKPGLKRNKFN